MKVKVTDQEIEDFCKKQCVKATRMNPLGTYENTKTGRFMEFTEEHPYVFGNFKEEDWYNANR